MVRIQNYRLLAFLTNLASMLLIFGIRSSKQRMSYIFNLFESTIQLGWPSHKHSDYWAIVPSIVKMVRSAYDTLNDQSSLYVKIVTSILLVIWGCVTRIICFTNFLKHTVNWTCFSSFYNLVNNWLYMWNDNIFEAYRPTKR